MAELSLDIERIVRQVLAELAGATAGSSSSASEKSPGATAG